MTEEDGADMVEGEENRKSAVRVAQGLATGQSVTKSVTDMRVRYAKPEYTGNRKIYDDGSAKLATKKIAFGKGKPVLDPYTGQELELRIRDAKIKYGADWQAHLAESDHKHPLSRVVKENLDNPWVTTEDIKEVGNSQDNLEAVSRKVNNAKRDRTNEELVRDKEYCEDKKLGITKAGKKKAIRNGEKSKEIIRQKINKKTVQHVATEAHQAGTQAATYGATAAGIVSSYANVMAVLDGTKSPEEALADVGRDVVVSAGTSYALGSMGAVAGHQVEYMLVRSQSPLLKAFNMANLPGAIVSSVIATGGTLKAYLTGKITTEECILQLGQTGIATTICGYTATVGQALIPIPIVGAVVGTLVGSIIADAFGKHLLAAAAEERQAEAEYRMIRAQADMFIRKAQEERNQFELLVRRFFAERAQAISEGLETLEKGCERGDFETATAGMNRIAQSFQKTLPFRNKKEFEEFQMDPNLSLEL